MTVGPDTCYVSPAGLDIWPYDSAENAATGFEAAIAASGRRVVVLPGNYASFARMTDHALSLACLASVRKALTIEGSSDPNEVVIDCGGGIGFILGHPDAVVSGITITNAYARTDGSALILYSGIATNCVVRITLFAVGKSDKLRYAP